MEGGFWLFELGIVDLSLGVTWLVTLGKIKANSQTLSMTLKHARQNIKIQGDQAHPKP